MSLETSLYSRLSTDAAVIAVLPADRIAPTKIPDQEISPPWCFYSVTEAEPVGTLTGQTGLAKFQVDFDLLTNTYADARTAADAVRTSLDLYQGGQVHRCLWTGAGFQPVAEGYHATVTFEVYAYDAATVAVAGGTARIVTTDTQVRICGELADCDGTPISLDGPDLTPYARTDTANTFTDRQAVSVSDVSGGPALQVNCDNTGSGYPAFLVHDSNNGDDLFSVDESGNVAAFGEVNAPALTGNHFGDGSGLSGLNPNALAGAVPITIGGTGATTAASARNNLLPTQSGQSGKFLTTNGTSITWGTPTAGGPFSYNPATSGGTNNEAFGSGAGAAITSGDGRNTCVGKNAGATITTGQLNTFVGYNAGSGYRADGVGTTAVGFGISYTGTNCHQDTIIGGNVTRSGSSQAGAVSVGWGNTVGGDSTVVIGAGQSCSTSSSVLIGVSNTVTGSGGRAIGKSNSLSHSECFIVGEQGTSDRNGEMRYVVRNLSATSFGMNAVSATVADRRQLLIANSWVSNTDATRKARSQFYAGDASGDGRECLRLESNGSAGMVGFLGAAASAQQPGGASTASTSTYGATEAAMLQKAYDCLRTFGFLS